MINPWARLELFKIAEYLAGAQGPLNAHIFDDCINDLDIYLEYPVLRFLGDTLVNADEVESVGRLVEAVSDLLLRYGGATTTDDILASPEVVTIGIAASKLSQLIISNGQLPIIGEKDD